MTDISVIVGGVETYLSSETPWWVESIEAAGQPPGHLIETRGPQQHGATVEGYRLDPREIELVLGWQSDGLSDTIRSALVKLFARRDTANALRVYRDGGQVRQIDWHLQAGPLLGRRGRDVNLQKAAIVLRCPDPAWYDPEQRFVNFGLAGGGDAFVVPMVVPTGVGASTLDQSVLIAYAGDVDSYPVITITGPIEDARIENTATGDVLDFDGVTIGVSETRVIDLRYGRKTVVDELGANALPDLTDDSDLATWRLVPDPDVAGGNNSIRVTGLGVTAATQIVMRYYDRYLGV